MSAINIRVATKKDSNSIYLCVRGLAEHVDQSNLFTTSREELTEAIFNSSNNINVIIAENNDEKTVGFALFIETFSTFKAKINYFIEDLFVLPDYRNQGIGTMLFQYIINQAKENGCKKVEWYVNNNNNSAIDFYKSMGAKELDYKSILLKEL